MFKLFRSKTQKVCVSAYTDVGRVRKTNQDNLFIPGELSSYEKLQHYKKNWEGGLPVLLAVSDGMGGGSNGEAASYATMEAIQNIDVKKLKKLNLEELEICLLEMAQNINDHIYQKFQNSVPITGCTLTLLYLDVKKLVVMNVGDSPCIRYFQGKIDVLSCSDNRANHLYRMGQITEEERWTHRTKNQLTQHMGMNPKEVLLSPHFYHEKNPSFDNVVYLLCSDGLMDGLTFEQMKEKLRLGWWDDIAESLVMASMDNGSRDNVTAELVYLEAEK